MSSSALARARLSSLALRISFYPTLPSINWKQQSNGQLSTRSFASGAVVCQSADRGATTTTATPTTTPTHQLTSSQSAPFLSTGAKVQPFDFTSLSACVAELRRLWVPARVEEAVQYHPSAVALRLRTMEHTTWLYLSWNPTLAHIGISEEGPPRGSAAQVFSFGEQMHSTLKGLVLTGATIPQPWERTMALEFSVRPGEKLSENQVVVYVEIVGRYSNVVLSQGGNVIGAGHQVGTKMSSVRAVYVGKPYTMPPPPHGIPPTSCESFDEWKAVVLLSKNSTGGSGGGGSEEKTEKAKSKESSSASSPTILSALTRNFLGVSPSLVRHFCETVGIAPETDPAVLETAAWQDLYSQWTYWLKSIEGENLNTKAAWSPFSGAYSVVTSDTNKNTSLNEEMESPLRFMRSYYNWFESGNEFEQVRTQAKKL